MLAPGLGRRQPARSQPQGRAYRRPLVEAASHATSTPASGPHRGLTPPPRRRTITSDDISLADIPLADIRGARCAITQGHHRMSRNALDLGRFAEPALLILISLADQPRHGYAMMEDIAEFSS